jgi:ribosomal protein S18 acetylase RimI-like enzyme
MTAPGTNPPGRVTVRPATAEDAETIAVVWHAGWRDGHLGHVPASLVAHRNPETFRARVPARIADSAVAVAGPEVMGFVTVRDAEIEQLYVRADARGTGVADALLRHGEHMVASGGRSPAWLAVVPGNVRARRFYERNGWLDRGPYEYQAEIAGRTFTVPCRRYEKPLPSAFRRGRPAAGVERLDGVGDGVRNQQRGRT